MLQRHALIFASFLTSFALDAHLTIDRPAGELIQPSDLRQPAGELKGGVLTIHLEARTGTWYPEGPNGGSIETAAWAEVGKPLQTPGPLIRVPAGTRVKASLRNALAKPLTVYGFGAARGLKDSVVIEPGATKDAEFVADAAGTYYYVGKTIGPAPVQARINEDAQLDGAIVVDPPGARVNDRIFVIGWWFLPDSTSPSGLGRGTMTINGLSWPHTEKLDLVQNDSVHWRVVNLTALNHPMHLHGFYFRVDAHGDGVRDSLIAPADRQMAVTEIVNPYETMQLSWVPSRPGNWIFHCHFAGHLSHLVSMETQRGVAAPQNDAHHMTDAPHQMYGLVMGLRVSPRTMVAQAGGAKPRNIRMFVREKENVYGTHQGYAFVLGGTPDEANADALPVPGPTLVLDRGQPVAVTIINRSKDRAAIHWHGIELDSYPDGVPGWSGAGKDILPSVAPGDSIVVRFTPPRAGTFMYHSHFNEFKQITSGLYGALIVKEPGQKIDSATDRTFIVSDGGPTTNVIAGPFPPMFLNGQANPAPVELRAGTRYRLRVIGITGDVPILFTLSSGGKPVEWRLVARDGMTLPAQQATSRPAALVFDPGQIYDFEYTPKAAGELTISYGLPPFAAPKDYKLTQVAVHVK